MLLSIDDIVTKRHHIPLRLNLAIRHSAVYCARVVRHTLIVSPH
jgi:hypothetical protein